MAWLIVERCRCQGIHGIELAGGKGWDEGGGVQGLVYYTGCGEMQEQHLSP